MSPTNNPESHPCEPIGKIRDMRRLVETDQESTGRFTREEAGIIPKHELWIHKNPKAKKLLEKGLEQARQGRGKRNTIDLDNYEV